MRQKRKARGEAERAAAATAENLTDLHAEDQVEDQVEAGADAVESVESADGVVSADLMAAGSGEVETATASAADDVEATSADHDDDEIDETAAASNDEVPAEDARNMPPERFKALVEALVFASDKPLTLQRIRQLTRVTDTARIVAALDELAADAAQRGVVLQAVSGGYMYRTQSTFSPWVQQLVAGRPVRLSRAQLDTLAIIAYRQPITRPEIDDIRGVDSGGTLKVLLERQLIRILGKKEEPGRPLLYGTTKEFLDFFSLSDLRELPTLREYSELSEENRRLVETVAAPPAGPVVETAAAVVAEAAAVVEAAVAAEAEVAIDAAVAAEAASEPAVVDEPQSAA